jgi:hypothetical protein
MPHKIKLAPARSSGLRPRSARDKVSLLTILVYVGVGIVGVAATFALQRHWQRIRELNWSSATGTILDVQPGLPVGYGSTYRPGALYTVKVLVHVSLGGVEQERWIELRQHRQSRTEIQVDAQRWRGATCIVRWNSADISQIDAEVS